MRLCLPFTTIKNVIRKLKYVFLVCLIALIIFFVFLHLSFSVKIGRLKHERRRHHSLCVIVPFRDRFEELLDFAPYMNEFLRRQNIKHEIFVINQIDSYRFNRGALINIGFKYSAENNSRCDYVVMHDVDLLPLNHNISYAYPGNYVFHVASPNLHPRYHYQTFIGGILIINKRQFQLVDGLSNKYWGWGMEDDEFYLRLKEYRIQILRPGKLDTDITNTFRHNHGSNRKRDGKRCYNQAKANLQRDRDSGLHNVNYKIISDHLLTIDGIPLTLVNAELRCDRMITPWCICESRPFQLQT